MLAFFRDGAKASQAARSISLITLRSPQVGAGFLPLSTITPPWLIKWGALILSVFSFPSYISQLPGSYPFYSFFSLSLLSFTACDGANISG